MVLCDWGREVPKVYSDTRNTTCKCTHWHSWRKRRGDWDKVVRRKSTTVGEGLGVSYLVVIIEALRATLLIGHLLQGCRARLRRQERGRHTRGSVLKHSEDNLRRIAIVSLPFWLSARWDPPRSLLTDAPGFHSSTSVTQLRLILTGSILYPHPISLPPSLSFLSIIPRH